MKLYVLEIKKSQQGDVCNKWMTGLGDKDIYCTFFLFFLLEISISKFFIVRITFPEFGIDLLQVLF